MPILALIRRHRQSGVLVDTNLLILFLVGAFEPRSIASFNRTSSYSEADFAALAQVLQAFERIIVTPHILTEVSNLARDIGRNRRYEFFLSVAALLNNQAGRFVVVERHRPARLISREPEFPWFGLTDAAIVHHAVHRHHLVLTDDEPLAEQLRRRGIDCIRLHDL